MRRLTKLTAAMLVLTCATTMVPQKVEAYSVIDSIINLLSPSMTIKNTTGRDVRFRVWSDQGEYWKYRVSDNKVIEVYSDADATLFAVEAAVWNGSKGQYIVKDYAVFESSKSDPTHVEFYKYARGDFRLRTY